MSSPAGKSPSWWSTVAVHSCPIAEWLDQALAIGMRLLELTPRIIVGSTQLPGTFHRDPADQLIVATARMYHCPLVTVDTKILAYPHV